MQQRTTPAQRIAELEAELSAARTMIAGLESQLRNLADHDPLTDLRNRRAFEQDLDAHLAFVRRYGPEGALLVIGLDGLNEVTSVLGAAQADELLVAVAEAVVDRLRTTDIVCRWAADELAVLLPRAVDDHARRVGEKVVEVVRSVITGGAPAGCITASVGTTPFTATDEAEDVIVRASLAMLAARRSGGDRAIVEAPAA